MKEFDLEALSPGELIKLSEETICGFKYDRALPYRKAFDKYKKIGDEQAKSQIFWDLLAFELMPTDGNRRFGSKFSVTNEIGAEQHFPDLDTQFPPESIDYYKKRITETKNPVLKARYADLVYAFTKEYQYVTIAAKAYLECGNVYVSQENGEWDHEAIQSFERGMRLAWKMNIKDVLDEYLFAVNGALETLMTTKRYRFSIELIELLLSCSSKLKEKLDLAHLREIADEASRFYELQEGGFHLQQVFLELINRISQTLKDRDTAIKTKLRLANMFINEAEARIKSGSGHAVAASFYQDALNTYLDLGSFPEVNSYLDRSLPEILEQVKVKIQECYKEAINEMIPISENIEVPQDKIAKHLAIYDVHDPEHFLGLMGNDPSFLISWEHILEHRKELAKKFPLQNLFATSVIKGQILIKQITDEQEKLNYNAVQSLSMGYRMISILYLTELFSKYKNLFYNYRERLVSYLGRTGTITPDRMTILSVGVERFFEQDYISACHIFIFQIEGILRDMVGMIGQPTYSYNEKNQEMRERTLTDLIHELGDYGVNKDLLKMMSVLLNDILGDNLRNDVAHGICGAEVFNQSNAQLLLFILIKLTAYEKDQVPSPEVNTEQ